MKLLGCFLYACIVALVAAAAPASAKEYCPVEIGASHVFDGQLTGTIALALRADAARNVTANLTIETAKGWYRAALPRTSLTEHDDHFELSTVTFDRADFTTQPLYVRLPADAGEIVRWYVDSASVDGDTAHVFPDGNVGCTPPGTVSRPGKTEVPAMEPVEPKNPPFDISAPPPSNASFALASAISAPSMPCAKPFEGATVTKAVQPDWPRGYRLNGATNVLVRVSVNATGGVDDAALWVPAGIKAFDDEAIRAAVSSTYRPAIALCAPVPGEYLFRVYFSLQ